MVTEATSFISEILDLQFLNVGSLCCICVILCLMLYVYAGKT